MIPTVLAALAALAVRSLAAARLRRWYLGAPLVMVLAGVAAAIGDAGALAATTLVTPVAQRVAEVTLAILLFADATEVRAGRLGGREPAAVARLLLVALPLSLGAATLLGALLLPGVSWVALLVVACVVVPVDLAPVEGIVRDRTVPSRVRSVLAVEGGYNDGVVSPVFLFALVLASDRTPETTVGEALASVVPSALTALSVGLVLGALLGWLVDRAAGAGWTTASSRRVVVLTVPLATYAVTAALGGSGFVASFVAGVVFRSVHGYAWARRRRRTPPPRVVEAPTVSTQDYRLLEDATTLSTGLMWFAVGSAAVAAVVAGIDPSVLLFCLGALTVVRVAPVLLALLGSSLRHRDRVLVAVLGPRGTTTIVFGLLAFNGLPAGSEADTILVVTVVCVLASVVAQVPLSGVLARVLLDRSPADAGRAPTPPVPGARGAE